MGNHMSNIATPMPPIRARFTSKLGIPLSGCKVYTYEPNSNIPKTTWIDIDKTVENTNPILLDAAGEADIFLDGLYQIVVKDRFGFVVYDVEKTGNLTQWDASFIVDGNQNQKQINQSQEQINQDQKQINLYGAKTYNSDAHPINSKIVRDDGVIVQSVINDNTSNPNVSMANWRGFISGRRYIDVADYIPSDDTQDVYAGVAAAFAAAQGREVVFTNPYIGSRTYRFLNRTNGGIIVPDGARVICEGNAKLDFSAFTKSGSRKSYFRASGTQEATTHALASNTLVGTRIIALSSANAAFYEAGDYIIISSSAIFGIYSYDTQGEFARIVSKTGNTLTLDETVHADYLISDAAYVRKINLLTNVSFEGLNIIGSGRFLDLSAGDSGIVSEFVKGLKIDGATIKYADSSAVRVDRCLNFDVKNFETAQVEVPWNDIYAPQYGVTIIGGSMYGTVSNGTARHGRHGVVWSDIGLAGCGISRYVNVDKVTAIGQLAGSFVTHTNSELSRFIDCNSTGAGAGIDIRVPNVSVEGLKVRGLRPESNLQSGILLRSLAKNTKIKDLTQYGGVNGVTTVSTDTLLGISNLEISDCHFYSQSQRAINIVDTSSTGNATGIKITDNYVESNSGPTIRSLIPTKNINIRDNFVRGLTSNVAGSSAIQVVNGQDVIAIDNTSIGYVGSVLIQSSTGTHINRGNEVLPL